MAQESNHQNQIPEVIEEPTPKIQKLDHNGAFNHTAAATDATTTTTTATPVVRVRKLSPKAVLPSRESHPSVEHGLSSATDTTVPARGRTLVPTDLSNVVPEDIRENLGEFEQSREKIGVSHNVSMENNDETDAFDENDSFDKNEVVSEEFVGDNIDYSGCFDTDRDFVSDLEAINYARVIANSKGFELKINSHKEEGKRKVLTCARGGRYRGKIRDTEAVIRKNKKSKRCDCPFRIAVHELRENSIWRIRTFPGIRGMHNHQLAVYQEGYRQMSGLSPEVKKLVCDMTSAQMKPSAIMTSIHTKFPEDNVHKKQVYNYIAQLRRMKSFDGRSVVKQFNSQALQSNYESSSSSSGNYPCAKDSSWRDINDLAAIHYIPSIIKPYVEGVTDVIEDGNCGFRVVAQCIMKDENEYGVIRRQIANEIQANRTRYSGIYPNDLDTEISRIGWEGGRCHIDHWMTTPDDLFVVATLFNAAVFSFRFGEGDNHLLHCYTILPLCGESTTTQPRREIIIAHLGNTCAHYIRLNLFPDFPVPPIHPLWFSNHDHSVDGWDHIYDVRRRVWDSIRDSVS